jgi:hypothetical protein
MSFRRPVPAGWLLVGFEHPLVRTLDVALDHLYRLGPFAPFEHLEELEVVLEPGLGEVMAESTPVDQIEKNLRT